MPLARICLLLAVAILPAAPARAESLTKDRPVVIVVGLPGDVESEKAFGDETLALLKILDSPAMRPSSVTLLSGIATPDFKPTFPLQSMPNDRATVLSLADKLKAAQAKAPVFFVFGHGGLQGNDPVFHVPGPRLQPANFASVAGASDESTWLLFFPGSGAFATALQGPKRTILATEAGQAFTQDPISFPLFLDLLKSEPDLARLGPKLGAATDQWYSSRTLARTEEPALWIDGRPPQKLVGAPMEVAAAVSPSVAATQPTPGTGPTPPDDAWNNIQPVKASDFPQSDGVILSRRVSYLIDDANEVEEDEETFLQILTPEGKRFGDFDFTYTPPDEDLEFTACEVKRPDGQIEQLDPDSIHAASGTAPEGYTAPTKKMFSLPHAEPGAILHVRMQRTSRHFEMPHLFEEIPLAEDVPIVALAIGVTLPEKSAFHFRFCGHDATDPAISRTQYGVVYAWQFQNLPAAPQDPLSPPDANPVLAISTFPDWTEFADWYRRLSRESDLITPEITAQARDLVANAKTDREKIAAVTEFVTNFRYVSIPLGVNSLRPHAAANILKSRYGDCKDKANLLNTLLKSLGYETSLVLVPRFSQAYDDLPGFAFNHAISQVKLGGQTLWIDSTDDVCRVGLLPPGDPGRKVLVVNDPANALVELPLAAAHDHRLTLKTTLDFSDPAHDDAQAKIEAQGEGFADYLLRASAKEWKEKARGVPLLDGAFAPASGAFDAHQQTTADVADLAHDFTWQAGGTWWGLMSRLPQSPVRMVRLPCWLPKDWPVALMPRTSPLQLNSGYPMEISQVSTIHLPAAAQDVKLPASQNDDDPVLSWKLSWTQAAPGEVDADLELALLHADLDSAGTQAFQASCRRLQQAVQDGFSFQIP